MAWTELDHVKWWNLVAFVVHYAVAIFVTVEVDKNPWDAPFIVRYSLWNQTEEGECSAESQCLITEDSVRQTMNTARHTLAGADEMGHRRWTGELQTWGTWSVEVRVPVPAQHSFPAGPSL